MPYMTILHWIGVVFFILIFLILSFLALKERDKKVRNMMIFSSFVISVLGMVITIFALDKYTKKAKILSYTQKRILSTESVVFNGRIKNIGDFMIGECKLKIKFTNNIMKIGRPKDTFFKPTSSLGFLFGEKKDTKPNVIKEEFVVAKMLKPKEIKSFRVSMKYPPYMNSPAIKLSLNCH